VAEDGVAQAAGVIRFTDDDLSDRHGASVTPLSGTAFGTLTLGAVDEAEGAAGGSVGWSYTLDNAAAQTLAAGQTVTERFEVAVSDGKGGTATQVVEVAVAGANDRPFFTSRPGDAAGAFLTETDGGLTSGPQTTTLVDPDTTDALSVEVRSVKVFLTDAPPSSATLVDTPGLDDAALAALGLDRAEIIDWFDIRPTTGDAFVGTGNNNATWTFDSQDEAFDFLDAGEVLTIYYNSIRPDDGQGGVPIGDGATVIRITGTADDMAFV
jgi:VCBS repeat-containing protein